MSADFGAIETILSLFLAGLFGVTGYLVGYSIALKGNQIILLAVVLACATIWAWVVFITDYPHALAASKAILIADATLWPLCLGTVAAYFINTRPQARHKQTDDWSV